MNELKPCPFCGSPVHFNHNAEFEPDGILCMRCKTVLRFMRIRVKNGETFGECQSKMADVWNRRVADEQG